MLVARYVSRTKAQSENGKGVSGIIPSRRERASFLVLLTILTSRQRYRRNTGDGSTTRALWKSHLGVASRKREQGSQHLHKMHAHSWEPELMMTIAFWFARRGTISYPG